MSLFLGCFNLASFVKREREVDSRLAVKERAVKVETNLTCIEIYDSFLLTRAPHGMLDSLGSGFSIVPLHLKSQDPEQGLGVDRMDKEAITVYKWHLSNGGNCPRDAQGRLCGKGEPAHRKERDGKETTVFADAGIPSYSFMMESAEGLSFTGKFALLDVYLTHLECPSSIRTLRWSIGTAIHP